MLFHIMGSGCQKFFESFCVFWTCIALSTLGFGWASGTVSLVSISSFVLFRNNFGRERSTRVIGFSATLIDWCGLRLFERRACGWVCIDRRSSLLGSWVVASAIGGTRGSSGPGSCSSICCTSGALSCCTGICSFFCVSLMRVLQRSNCSDRLF